MVIKKHGFDILIVAVLLCVVLLIVIPLYYVVVMSFTTYTQYIQSSGLVVFPWPISLDGYKNFLANPKVPRALLVTLFITVAGTVANMLFTVSMAYPLSRKELPMRRFFMVFTLIPLVFNGGLIPNFYVVRLTGIMNTVWAMIIPSLIWAYNLTITRSFFAGIDDGYIESARIDGAGELRVLVTIVLPLAKPVLATVLLMYGVGHWNEFFAALYYVQDASLQPLQVVLRGILSQAQSTLEETNAAITASTQAMKQAAVVITALPVVLVYPFLQKHFTQGMMLGGIKG